MTFNSVSDIFDDMQASRKHLCQTVEGFSSAQAGFKIASDAWCVSEILEHLSLAEQRSIKRFSDAIVQAEIGGRSQIKPGQFQSFSFDEYAEKSRGQKIKAPEALVPSGAFSMSELLQRLKASREELWALKPGLEAYDFSETFFPHPVFGPMNLYQWLALVSFHENRHLRQIQSVMASPGFPLAA